MQWRVLLHPTAHLPKHPTYYFSFQKFSFLLFIFSSHHLLQKLMQKTEKQGRGMYQLMGLQGEKAWEGFWATSMPLGWPAWVALWGQVTSIANPTPQHPHGWHWDQHGSRGWTQPRQEWKGTMDSSAWHKCDLNLITLPNLNNDREKLTHLLGSISQLNENSYPALYLGVFFRFLKHLFLPDWNGS